MVRFPGILIIVIISVRPHKLFERDIWDYIYELFEKIFDILDPSWRAKLVGITTDGAANMIGCHQGAVTKIWNKVLSGGFICVWCVLYQLGIVIQKCATSY